MTAVAGARRAPAGRGGRRELAGTGTLLRLALRRDRVLLPVWTAALGLTVVNTAAAIESLYGTAAERAGLARSMTANSSLRALYGPVFDPSVGGLVAWRMMAFGGVLAAVMSLIIVVRHTREEEETGRQELLSAAVVGRRAPLTSALLAALTANALLAALIAAGLTGLGLPGAGSLAFGLAVAAQGLVFAALAAVAAQLTETARAAKGLTGAVLGLAFVLRAAGDAGTADGEVPPLTALSPIGWAVHVRPYADERWWLLPALFALAAGTAAGAYALAGRRDIGAGLLPARPGPATAPRLLGGAYGLAWRLQRGSLLGWCAGFAVAGAVFGGIAEGAADLVGDSEQTRQIFERLGGRQGVTDSLLAATIGMLGLTAGVYAVGGVLRLRGEETGERAEPLLASALSRLRWAASHLVIAFSGTVAVLLSGGLAAGTVYGAAAGDLGGQLPRVTAAALAQVPAVWTLAAVAVLLFGALPKAAPVAWAVVGACVGLGWLGPVLDLPQAVLDLSPFGHLPKLPGAEVSAAPFGWLLLLAAVLTGAGLAAFRRRDLGA